MIHAACSNSNHLQTRRKPDADKGQRNQCRLSTASLLIPSVFPSEHLGYPEGRLLLFLGLFCLLGLPGEVTRDGESRVQEKTGPVEQGGLTAFPHFLYCSPRVSPVFQTHLEEQWLSPTGWLRILCGFYSAKLELESWAHLLKLTSLR